MSQAVIYARVSTKEQEREGFSIPAQLELLKNYADKNGIFVVKVFRESETAKKAGRKAFNEMLNFVKEKNIKIILVEKTDRLYRNFKDYVTIDEIKDIEIHFVKEGVVLSEKASSSVKLAHGFKVLMAKNYIDNLREEVIKGRNKKIEYGEYPQRAPLGYKNVYDKATRHRVIVPDIETAPFVKRAFTMYAKGLSLDDVREKLAEEGFLVNGKTVAKTTLARTLHSPIYIGKMELKGVIYQASHTPIISVDLWNKVQTLIDKGNKTRSHNVVFPYTGLITCGICGCQFTAELKKGRYIYYHCTGKRGGECKTKKEYVRQEELDDVFVSLVKRIANKLPDDVLNRIKSGLKDMQRAKNEYEEFEKKKIDKQIATIKRRLDSLYIDKLDGKISEEFFEEKNIEWHAEQNKLLTKLQSLNNVSREFYEGSNLLLDFCKSADRLYIQASPEKKRQILKLIGSNFIYKSGNVAITLNPAFDFLLNCDLCRMVGDAGLEPTTPTMSM